MDVLMNKGLSRRKFLGLLGAGAATLATGAFPAWPALAGDDFFTHALAGQDLIARGKYPEAVDALARAVSIDPESDWAWGLLGRAYFGWNRYAHALTAFQKALIINPSDTYSRMMIGRITQRPVSRSPETVPDKPPTGLEREALEEEKQFLSGVDSRHGLEYQVRRVVVDAGHGGFDPGAVGRNGLQEKDVTLDIAKRLYEHLEQGGKIEPFLTRRGDYYVPLAERTTVANQYRADLFISVHINANENRSAHGTETFYCSENASSREAARVAEFENSVLKFDDGAGKRKGYVDIEDILFQFERRSYWTESGRFAEGFQDRMEKSLPLKSRGVHSANFHVLRTARMPSILLECGFISNPDEEARLSEAQFRDRIARAVAGGLA
ncbi:MAG: N-acetylmuramoyl-L-alanine amidase [Desulfatibacillaceae bacterium]